MHDFLYECSIQPFLFMHCIVLHALVLYCILISLLRMIYITLHYLIINRIETIGFIMLFGVTFTPIHFISFETFYSSVVSVSKYITPYSHVLSFN